MKTKYLLIIFSFFFAYLTVYSQAGMTFQEFSSKIEPYFDQALIDDIRKELPIGDNFKVWGWDVGDYSGDGYFDLAFAVKKFSNKKREVEVYMFVDIDGYLTKVEQLTVPFVDIPLEVGVVIKADNCYINQKLKQYHWSIKGYEFDNGSLILVDEYETEQIDKYTHQSYKNYQEFNTKERVIVTSNNKEEFNARFTTLPSYPRGRKIYKGYEDEVFNFDIDYIYKGAYDWKGEDDASFYVKSAHDDEFLYFIVSVKDDEVIVPSCEECSGDMVEMWLDVNEIEGGKNRMIKNISHYIEYRNSIKEGVYRFSIYLGNFEDEKPYINISSNQEMNTFQKANKDKIKIVTKEVDEGFRIKFKVPFTVLGFSANPASKKEKEFGCSFVFHDIDNEFRPEQKTEIASSLFSSQKPTSYGSIILFPEDKWYGESKNIYKDKILKYLKEYGY